MIELRKYQRYQGNPCYKGHSGLRYLRSNNCVECSRLHKIKNKERHQKNNKEYQIKNKEKLKANERKRLYGISEQEYNNLLSKQNNKCAICKQEETAKSSKGNGIRRLSIDHCKKTKKIRGLLCFSCNLGLGYLKHDPNFLRIAALYCEEI